MLFNSLSFMAFFVVMVIIYYLLPQRSRWPLLLAGSLYFYAALRVEYVLLLIWAAAVAYLAALGIERARAQKGRKAILTTGLLLELGTLFIFKYYNFALESLQPLLDRLSIFDLPSLQWLLPAGLSFFSFSCVSYIVDVYRGKLRAERHLGRAMLYVAFFPKLLAGPIERATTFLPQTERVIQFDPWRFTQGLQIFLWGMFKKVVIADRLAAIVDAAFQMPTLRPPVQLIIAAYFFAFQIYCDFSGYSDMAIGTAKMLGFDLMENFRRPYLATSIPEFWSRRWHISLCCWFRDYLYIPLGGNRVSKARWYMNQMIVFLVSGLWHGANWTFVVWGVLNGGYQVVYYLGAGLREKLARIIRLPRKLAAFINWFIVFHLVTLAWVFFRASSVSEAWAILERIVQSIPKLPMLLRMYRFNQDFYLSIGLIAVLLLVDAIDEIRPLWERLRTHLAIRWAVYYAMILGLVVLGKWAMTEFIYMQF